MPFKSDKQRKWMYANEPEMAKKWEKEEAIKGKLRNLIKQEIKSVNNESTKEYGKTLDKIAKDRQLKSLSKKDRDTLVKIAKLMKRANESKLEATTTTVIPPQDTSTTYKKSTQKAIDIDDEDDEKSESMEAPFRRRNSRGLGRVMKVGLNEGKWSKIMTSVRKGSKSGPWSIVVYKNKKVKHQRLVKILQQIPAHYEDVKKKYPRDKIGIEDKYGERVYTESIDEYKKFRGKMTYGGGKPKKGDYVKTIAGIAQIEKIRGTIAYMKLPGKKTKGYWMNDLKNIKPTDKMEKGKTLWTESVNESDLGLTYKKGKTVKVTHKKSGKELIIIDKPNVKKEYEKIGYFAEGQVNELSMAPFSSQEARAHINSDIKDMSKHLGKASQQVIKIMMSGVKSGKYTAMDISRGIKEGPTRRTHFGEMTFINSLWTKMREKFRKYSKDRKLS
jgi:hypothetical protein